MWKHIIFQVIYQLIIMNLFIFYGKEFFIKKNAKLNLGEQFIPEQEDSIDKKNGFFRDIKYNAGFFLNDFLF